MKSHSSSSDESFACRRPSSSARSWSLSQSLLQNATAAAAAIESSSSATTTPSSTTAASSEQQNSAKKSVVLVKLTDAAIRALEEYVKLANEVRD